MFEIEKISGEKVRVNFRVLCRLAALADWQLRNLGYDPLSVATAFLTLENIIESAQTKKIIDSVS